MLKKIKNDIDADLKDHLKSARDALVKGSSTGMLYDGIRDFVSRGGKRVRPMLMVISYLGYTRRKKTPYGKLIRCAVSLELMHDFFLVHDDVIDRSDLRRGKPTLHRVFNKELGVDGQNSLGPNLSIVAGDILFTLAIEAFLGFDEDPLRKEKALSQLLRTARDTGIGEFIDVVNDVKKISDVTEEDVLLTYILKTARYTFESPLVIGATLAGCGGKELEKLSGMGLALGQAFQIQDDLLDIFSTSKKIGKPVLSDLNESKKTLFAQRAYTALGESDRRILKRIFEKNKKTYNDLMIFRDLIKKSEAHKYCIQRADDLLAEAFSILASLGMKTRCREALGDLARSVFSKTKELKDILT